MDYTEPDAEAPEAAAEVAEASAAAEVAEEVWEIPSIL